MAVDQLLKMMQDAAAKRQATGEAPKAIDNVINPTHANSVPQPPTPTAGVSATSAGLGVPKTGAVPSPSQQSAQAWINNPNSGFQGGVPAYQANQQTRFNEASASGNQELLGRLNADAQRVGYAFQPYSPPQAQATQQNVNTPYMQLTPSQINQEAGYQINKERSDLATAADKQMALLKNNAGYSNKLIQDNRTLEDFRSSNSVNPFTEGKQTWDKGLIGRQRSIDDTFRGANLDAELNAVSQDLYNFDKLAPDKQRALINEMTRIERDYGLNVGQLTGNFNGQRTLAGQNQDFNQGMANKQFGLDESSVTGTYKGQQTQQAQNQQFNQNMATQQLQRNNFESDRQFEFAKGQQEWENNFKSGQFDFQKAQQIYENTFKEKSFEQDMKEAAASRGLQWASLNQRDKEFIADQEFKEKQFQWGKDLDIAQTWQKTREMDLAEKKLNQTEAATFNEAMQKAIDAALKDPSYVSAKDTAAKNKIIDGYYKQLTSGIVMTDEEIKQFLK